MLWKVCKLFPLTCLLVLWRTPSREPGRGVRMMAIETRDVPGTGSQGGVRMFWGDMPHV